MIVQFTDSPARGGGWTAERKGPIFELVNRRYKRTIIAISNDMRDGPETVLATPGMPQVGSSYALGNDADAIAVCVDIQAEPMNDSPFAWRVTATYDSSQVVDIALSNPLNLPPEITWSFAKYEVPMQRDADGIPMANSSGERFDPPLTMEESRPVFTCSRNEASFSQTNANIYQDAINSDVLGTWDATTAKMSSITAAQHIDIGIQYWKVNYEVEFNWRTFALFVLDQGYRDLNGKLFRDPIDFSPLANPTLLNGRGFRQVDTYAQLSGNITATDTSITVANPAGYTGPGQPYTYFPPGPTPGTANHYFEIKIDNEIMQVTGGFASNNWLVTRAYAGTTAAAHNSGATVYLQPYFLRFFKNRLVPFAPLNLPI